MAGLVWRIGVKTQERYISSASLWAFRSLTIQESKRRTITTVELIINHPVSSTHLLTSCFSPRVFRPLFQFIWTLYCHVSLRDCPHSLCMLQALPGLGRAHRVEKYFLEKSASCLGAQRHVPLLVSFCNLVQISLPLSSLLHTPGDGTVVCPSSSKMTFSLLLCVAVVRLLQKGGWTRSLDFTYLNQKCFPPSNFVLREGLYFLPFLCIF